MQQDCYIIANSLIDTELVDLLPRATISHDNYFVVTDDNSYEPIYISAIFIKNNKLDVYSNAGNNSINIA